MNGDSSKLFTGATSVFVVYPLRIGMHMANNCGCNYFLGIGEGRRPCFPYMLKKGAQAHIMTTWLKWQRPTYKDL